MNMATPTDFEFSFLEEGLTAKDFVDQKIRESHKLDDSDAFYVCDLGDVVKKNLRWARAMPRVTTYYAVKCNNSSAVIRTLDALGTGFDCASKGEIQQVLSMGVDPGRIIYANPCKAPSHVKYACEKGVQMTTFDNEEELTKVAQHHAKAKLLLRIATDDVTSKVPLSIKFGAKLDICRHLLERAKELDMNVIGVSFHVGTGCTDTQPFKQAIVDAHSVFRMGEELGFEMNLLDIGGGFPGSEDTKLTFEQITPAINDYLDKYFPAESGVRIIAEPGTYYVESAFTAAVNIIAKKCVKTAESLCEGGSEVTGNSSRCLMYYINDGVYSSFSSKPLVNAEFFPTLHKNPRTDEPRFLSSVWGQTCDGTDCVTEECFLPELQIGDWLMFDNMGAYTRSTASKFNGFEIPTTHYIVSHSAWQYMQQSHLSVRSG